MPGLLIERINELDLWKMFGVTKEQFESEMKKAQSNGHRLQHPHAIIHLQGLARGLVGSIEGKAISTKCPTCNICLQCGYFDSGIGATVHNWWHVCPKCLFASHQEFINDNKGEKCPFCGRSKYF